MKSKQYYLLQERMHKKFWKRIIQKQHKGRRIDKAINISNTFNHKLLYAGELFLAIILWFSTIIFGRGVETPNNNTLVYPLNQIAKSDCRAMERSSLADHCKLDLPIIQGANYTAYASPTYKNIYSVLFGASYSQGWEVQEGSHPGVKIRSAKGTPLYSIADGKIATIGEEKGYGKVVKVQFLYKGVSYYAKYAHLDTILVQEGQSISKGDRIATLGNSGRVSAKSHNSYLHFEILNEKMANVRSPFNKCEDFGKGERTIVNEGLCKQELLENALDPIAFLEKAQSTLPNHVNTLIDNPEESKKIRNHTLEIAKLFLESPYLMGGTGTKPGDPFDCSSFTQIIFSSIGITLERTAMDQAYQFMNGSYRYGSLKNAKAGDLVFFKNTYVSDREITHVGIYMGNNKMIHAGGDRVQISVLDAYWMKHFKGVGDFRNLSKNYNKTKAQKSFTKIASQSGYHGVAPDLLGPAPSPEVIILPEIPEILELPEVSPQRESEIKPQGVAEATPLVVVPEVKAQHEEAAPRTANTIQLNPHQLDKVGKAFFNEWDIQIQTLDNNSIKQGEEVNIKMLVKNKQDGSNYEGILKQPIILVSNNTNLTIEPVAISLVKNGEVTIKVKGNQSGPVYTAINMGINKMGGMDVKVL